MCAWGLLQVSATAAQVWVWHDNYSLWANAVKYAPYKARPHINLGAILEVQNQLVEAQVEYEIAVEASRTRRAVTDQRGGQAHTYAASRLARVLSMHGRLPEAIAMLVREGCEEGRTGDEQWIWRCHTDR